MQISRTIQFMLQRRIFPINSYIFAPASWTVWTGQSPSVLWHHLAKTQCNSVFFSKYRLKWGHEIIKLGENLKYWHHVPFWHGWKSALSIICKYIPLCQMGIFAVIAEAYFLYFKSNGIEYVIYSDDWCLCRSELKNQVIS